MSDQVGQESLNPQTTSRTWWGFFAFLAGFFIFRLFYLSSYQLTYDEAYYWTWTRNPAVCYYDQPGLVAWVGWLFTSVFGDNVYGVRLAAWTLAVGATLLIYRIALDLLDDRLYAIATATVLNFLPLFSAGALIYIHDSVLIFFWTLAVLAAVRIARQKSGWLLLTLAATAALYAKFSAVLLAPCLLLFLILWGPGRVWLRRPAPYVAVFFSAVLMLPIMAWNFRHLMVAFLAVGKLAAGQELAIAQRLMSVADYFGGQFLLFSPIVFALALWAMIRGLYRGWRNQDAVRLALGCLSLPVFGYFMTVAWQTKVQANWPMMGFVAGSVLTADLIRDLLASRRRKLWQAVVGGGLAMALLMTVVIHIHPLHRIVPFLEGRDISDQVYGWREMADRVSEELGQPGRENTLVWAKTYQVTSELEFYLPKGPRPYCVSYSGRGNQYDIDQDYRAAEGRDVLFVLRSDRKLNRRLQRHFEEVIELEPFTVLRQGKVIERYNLYLLKRFSIEGPYQNYFNDPLSIVAWRMVQVLQEAEDE